MTSSFGWRIAVVTVLVVVAACGGGDDDTSASPTTESPGATGADTSTTSVPGDPLVVLVTNDDGVGAPGIDALVNGLQTLDDVEVVVVAPAENQSGSGDATSDGEVTATPATTASGVAATAVAGKPADAVLHALDTLALEPDVVVSGVNQGQNIRDLSTVSGTVGAAKTAARQGIPSLAVSAGILDGEAEFDEAVRLALEWVEEHRSELGAVDGVAPVESLNVPTCPVGEVRGLVEVPVAAKDDRDVFTVDCESTLETPGDDVEGFVNGFAVLSPIAA